MMEKPAPVSPSSAGNSMMAAVPGAAAIRGWLRTGPLRSMFIGERQPDAASTASLGEPRSKTCVWVFFHEEIDSDHPEAAEIRRFQIAAARLGINLEILKPRAFDLVVDTKKGWSAVYEGRSLRKPDMIIARTGSETSYFMLAVLRHFERLGVAMVNGPEAIETVADKLHTLQILSAEACRRLERFSANSPSMSI